MVNQKTRDQYSVTIGIECHVQLKTRTKLFAAVGNDAREAPANSLISHICLGMPGALPVLNEEAVNLAMKAAHALKTTAQPFSKFDRKHYFYPDLPKGYQITQFEQPIIVGGEIDIVAEGQPKTVQITRAHLEEDAGKSTHPAGEDYSLVDLNRAGTPLLEIVSEPDMHSAAEAKAYAKELYLLMRYADVSDANLFYGNMRFDVNVSVSKDKRLGTRTETKNLNSFKSVEKAVNFEVNRQIELIEKGEAVKQETRGWDDAKQKTFSQRSKEDAHDYRYMPEPDVPPVELTKETIDAVAKTMSPMPGEWRDRLKQLGLDSSQVETLIEADIEDPEINYLLLIEAYLDNPTIAKNLANWFVNIEIPVRAGEIPINSRLTNEKRLIQYIEIFNLLKANKLSSTNAKALITTLLQSGAEPTSLEKYAEEQGYIQNSNQAEIQTIVEKVLADNPKAAEDVKNGEMKAIGFLVGQVMQQTRGKANPQIAQELIRKTLK